MSKNVNTKRAYCAVCKAYRNKNQLAKVATSYVCFDNANCLKAPLAEELRELEKFIMNSKIPNGLLRKNVLYLLKKKNEVSTTSN